MELQKKDWVIVGLLGVCALLLIEVVQTRNDLRAQGRQIESFLGKRLRGIPLSEYVRPDSLATFPDDGDRAIVCGVIEAKVSEKSKR